MEFRCPKCKKPLPDSTGTGKAASLTDNKFFPFCSERCKLIDIGAWLDEEYKIIEKNDPQQ